MSICTSVIFTLFLFFVGLSVMEKFAFIELFLRNGSNVLSIVSYFKGCRIALWVNTIIYPLSFMVKLHGFDKPMQAKADVSFSLDIICVDRLQLHHLEQTFYNSSQRELGFKHLQIICFIKTSYQYWLNCQNLGIVIVQKLNETQSKFDLNYFDYVNVGGYEHRNNSWSYQTSGCLLFVKWR